MAVEILNSTLVIYPTLVFQQSIKAQSSLGYNILFYIILTGYNETCPLLLEFSSLYGPGMMNIAHEIECSKGCYQRPNGVMNFECPEPWRSTGPDSYRDRYSN